MPASVTPRADEARPSPEVHAAAKPQAVTTPVPGGGADVGQRVAAGHVDRAGPAFCQRLARRRNGERGSTASLAPSPLRVVGVLRAAGRRDHLVARPGQHRDGDAAHPPAAYR